MRVVSFPEGWGSAEPADTMRYEVGGDAVLVGVLLEDGANLWALVYPEGARFLRTAGDTGWSLQESYEGEPPSDAGAAAWRVLLDEQILAGREVAEEMKAAGLGEHVPRRYGGGA